MVVSRNQLPNLRPVEVPVLPQVGAPGDSDVAGLAVLSGSLVYGCELLVRLGGTGPAIFLAFGWYWLRYQPRR